MNNNVPGVVVPQNLIDALAGALKGTAIKKGIEVAGRMIRQIRGEKLCDGVHVMAIGKEDVVPDILNAARHVSPRSIALLFFASLREPSPFLGTRDSFCLTTALYS